MSVPIGVTGKGRKMIYKYDSTGKRVGMDVVPCQIADAGDCWLDIPEGPQPNARYFYDPDNNRSAMITKANGDIYYFVYDPTASVPAVVYEQGPAKRYLNIREPDGSLVSRETYNWYGILIASRTYHYDGLGSTVALTDENGQVTDKYSYDEWGNVLSHTDAAGGQQNLTLDNPYQYVGRYGYYTHYQEPGFGLLQLGVRYYDPAIGRFTQHGSPYTFATNNPLGTTAPPARPPVKPAPTPRPAPPRPPVKPAPVSPGKGGTGIGAIACSALKAVGSVGRTVIGAAVGAVTLTFCAASPAGPTKKDLRDWCNMQAEDCIEFVQGMSGVSPGNKRVFLDWCYNCQMRCIDAANHGHEIPWPQIQECNWRAWPDGHPHYPWN